MTKFSSTPAVVAAISPLLEVTAIEVFYESSILAVADVSLRVGPGEIVALLGANGAGKSTTLKAISGLVLADRAVVSRGDIRLRGESVAGIAANLLAARGIVHVLEGRHVFGHLTVEENLRAGTFLRRPGRREMERGIEEIYGYFPRLRTKRSTPAGLTSGGEQQMLAIGRALLTRPELVLLDEPSMGLAPIIVEEIFEIITALNRSNGTAFLIAEQNVAVSLRHAHRGYVLDNGRVAIEANADELLARGNLADIYLGV
ncbi:ABC transporter ATP-binding protein [Ancylobacter sp. 6x-1]|uniref:ABC transporter ATP-binding protein n=1 Tax=Ancylobacter crimeensis TaxID=2579147 RepID=A0ABT0DFG3_9HYPH|nr:ABC transporter ATP-binding protein [Ancylobacter crimeensis]MCK0198705.1 ABC transporter ATP-binding protein [Ancylobacter crimeensis]